MQERIIASLLLSICMAKTDSAEIVHPGAPRPRAERASTGRSRHSRGPAWGKIIAFAVVVVALAAAWRYTPLSEFITHERIAAWARAVGDVKWAPIAMMLAYTPAAFVMFPRPLITLFGVVAFGPWLGFVYAMTGILLSALATYFTGRALPSDTVKRVAGDRVDELTRVLREHGLPAVFAMRIVPLAPHPVENVIAGAARIKLWHFAAGTFAGMLPGVLAATVFGDQIMSALEDSSRINYWLVGGVIVAIAAVTYFVSRWLARHTSP